MGKGTGEMKVKKQTTYHVETTVLKDQFGIPADLTELHLQAKNLKGKWITIKYPTEMRVIRKPGRKKK